jgi:hypothetical protein
MPVGLLSTTRLLQKIIRTYLKNNLSAHGGVVERLKMLTYCVYAPLFHRSTPPKAGFRRAQLAS